MADSAEDKLQIRPRLRVGCGSDIALGPGKVELLEWVHQTGSITEAARRMGMSYMRAWTLIRTMNRSFRAPIVVGRRGGSNRGGAELTEAGRQALDLYHEMNARCLEAVQPQWKELRKLLRDTHARP